MYVENGRVFCAHGIPVEVMPGNVPCGLCLAERTSSAWRDRYGVEEKGNLAFVKDCDDKKRASGRCVRVGRPIRENGKPVMRLVPG
jgi:hypothetical protein